MKTTFLLKDENTQVKLMLQDPIHTKGFLSETEAVAGCNCDRWGHPCAGCLDHKKPNETETPNLITSQTAR